MKPYFNVSSKNSNGVLEIEKLKNLLIPVFIGYGINRAVLFGSYAKGNASEKSDVDILVDSGLRGLKFVGLIDDMKKALGGKEVDVLDVTHIIQGSLIEKELINTGVEIYAK